jgi:hypothetical protein
MKTKTPVIQTRIVIAVSLLIAALISSIAITTIGNTSSQYWVAARAISPGEVIADTDVTRSSASLKNSSELYLSDEINPVGKIATRSIGTAELIAQSAISEITSGNSAEIVPLHLSNSDIPSDSQVGEEIAIYWVPESMGSQIISEPQLVLRGVYLRSIDKKNSNFGNDVAITVSVSSSQVISLLSATSAGRLVVVRARG